MENFDPILEFLQGNLLKDPAVCNPDGREIGHRRNHLDFATFLMCEVDHPLPHEDPVLRHHAIRIERGENENLHGKDCVCGSIEIQGAVRNSRQRILSSGLLFDGGSGL